MKLLSYPLAAAVVLSSLVFPLTAQAQDRNWRPHHRHAHVCHVERHKVMFHGRWVVKTTKVCR